MTGFEEEFLIDGELIPSFTDGKKDEGHGVLAALPCKGKLLKFSSEK